MNHSWPEDDHDLLEGDPEEAYRGLPERYSPRLSGEHTSRVENDRIPVLVSKATNLIGLLLEGEKEPDIAVFSANGLVGTVRHSRFRSRIFCSPKGDPLADVEAATLISKRPPHPVLLSCLRDRLLDVEDHTNTLLWSIYGLWHDDKCNIYEIIENWTTCHDWYCMWGNRFTEGQNHADGPTAHFLDSPFSVFEKVYPVIHWSNCRTLTDLVVTGERFRDALVLSGNGRVGTLLVDNCGPRKFAEVARNAFVSVLSEEQAVTMLREKADGPVVFSNPEWVSYRSVRFGSALIQIEPTYPVNDLVEELWGGVSSWKRAFESLFFFSIEDGQF